MTWQLLQRKPFNWCWLTVQSLRPLLSWQGAQQHAGTCGAGEVVKCYTSGCSGSRKRVNQCA